MDQTSKPKSTANVTWGEAVLVDPQPLQQTHKHKATFKSATNGNDFSLVFPDLVLKLDAENTGQGLHLEKVAGFRIPLAVHDASQLTGYAQRVIIGVVKTPGTRVVLLVDVGGVAKAVEYPYGQNVNDPLVVIELPRRITAGDAGSPPVVPFMATFTMLVQRLTTAENPILSVDGLDVTAVFGPFDAFTFPPPKVN